jgi:putative transposase
VTVGMREHVWNLRSGRAFRRIRRCLEDACGGLGLRVIEFAVLGNHIHLVVEADDSTALARGMKGLNVRIARALNRMMNRTGSVFADHYDARLLRSPTQLVRAIAYVLDNHRHHYATAGADPYCSATFTADDRARTLCLPLTWLLRDGWRRAPEKDRAHLAGTRYRPE